MKVMFYPAGNQARASSRYRVWWIVPARKDWKVSSLGDSEWENAQVLVFQRQQNGPAVKLAKAAKAHGKLVVFLFGDRATAGLVNIDGLFLDTVIDESLDLHVDQWPAP